MTDIRTRLADALAQHITCDCGEWAEDVGEGCEHLADVLLSQPDIAIVPAFSRGDRVRILPTVCDDNQHNTDLVGTEHTVHLALWCGGDNRPYQSVHLVIDGVEISFRASHLEKVDQ